MQFIDFESLELEKVSHNPEITKKVFLRAGAVPHLTNFSQATFSPGQVAQAHSHGDMWEVFWVASGTGLIIVNGESYPLTPGNCILVEPGDIHEVINNGDAELKLVYFGMIA